MTAGENARKAHELFNKAIEIDPNYARAHAWRACSMANTAGWYPDDFDDSWFDDCTASVTRALEIDSNDPEAHRIMGAIKLVTGDFDLATYHHERAVELCPSDAYIRSRYASLLIYLGEPQQALDEIHRAMRVDPFCPDVLFEDEGMGYYWLENYGKAIESLRKVKVPTRNSLFYLAAALAKAEQTETASATLKQAVTTMDMTVEGFVSSQGYKNQEQRDALLQTLEPIAV